MAGIVARRSARLLDHSFWPSAIVRDLDANAWIGGLDQLKRRGGLVFGRKYQSNDHSIFGCETNVSVGQFNQSSIKSCSRSATARFSRAANRSKSSVVCSETSYLPKNPAKLQDNHNVFHESLRENANS
jgi:hypothetical protein